MKTPAENPREVVNRFLGKLGEPLSPSQVERAIGRVHDRLDDAEALSVSIEARRASNPFQRSAVAAAILVMLIGGALQLLFLQPDVTGGVGKAVSGQVYFAESYRPLSVASRIEGGELVRAGNQGGVIALQDGSRIELSPQAELAIVHASDGMRVRLGSGTVIVTAATQRKGHLYVETKDLLVSVVGTVFSVSAESVGSRVSVIEGEVHVQQGQTVQTLRPGQQASTSPALGPLPVETELKWSKSAGELAALQQQQQSVPAAVPVPAPEAPPQAPSRILQGSVKLASKQEGIPGVTVTVCPGGAARSTRIRIGNPGASEEITLQARLLDGAGNGPIIRNKTFFFALWDAAAACASPVQAKTDAAGRFQVQGLAPGDYSVRAELEGYFGPVTNGTHPAFDMQQLTIEAQQPVPEVSLSLIRGGTITGRVRDAEGKAMVNTTVSAGMSISATSAFTRTVSRTTDDRGEYRLFGLPPGEYYVAVGGAQALLTKMDGASGIFRYFSGWNAAGQTSPQPAPTFFPSAGSQSEAVPVTVREGEDVAGIDIVLRPMLPSDAPIRVPRLK